MLHTIFLLLFIVFLGVKGSVPEVFLNLYFPDSLAPRNQSLDSEEEERSRLDNALDELETLLRGSIWKRDALIGFLLEHGQSNRVSELGPIVVPRATIPGEARMGLTPPAVSFLKKIFPTVRIIVEKGAGVNRYTNEVYYTDKEYRTAGADVLSEGEFFDSVGQLERKMIVSIKEPAINEELGRDEFQLIRGALLYTYLHFADLPDTLKKVLSSAFGSIAYETISLNEEGVTMTPVLKPASEAAGWLSAVRYAVFVKHNNRSWSEEERDRQLDNQFSSNIQSYPAIPPDLEGALNGKKVVVLGGGVAGENAAVALAKMGAQVTITEVNSSRIKKLEEKFKQEKFNDGSIKILFRENPGTSIQESKEDSEILEALKGANGIIGAILLPGGKAPVEIDESLYSELVRGENLEFIADIATDQGGNIETPEPFDGIKHKYSDGWVVRNGVVEFIVTNMPSALSKQVSQGLDRAKLVYLIAILRVGLEKAIECFPELGLGVNTLGEEVVNERVAGTANHPWPPRNGFRSSASNPGSVVESLQSL